MITEASTQHGADTQATQSLQELRSVSNQLNAPVGQFGRYTLSYSTRAPAQREREQRRAYLEAEKRLASLADDRGNLVDEIRQVLGNAEFNGAELTRARPRRSSDRRTACSRERTLWPVRSR